MMLQCFENVMFNKYEEHRFCSINVKVKYEKDNVTHVISRNKFETE